MSESPEVVLAEALVNALNELQQVKARRIYNAVEELENFKTGTEIFVIPNSDEGELGTRANTDREIAVHVAYVRKVKNPADLSEMDDCMRTLGKLKNLWLTEDGELRERDLADATWKSLSNSPLWEPELLRKGKLFFGRLTLTYWFES